jgi:hypothetical protein
MDQHLCPYFTETKSGEEAPITPVLSPKPKSFLLTLGHCDSCFISPRDPGLGKGDSDGGQEGRGQKDCDKPQRLAEEQSH